MEPRSFDRGDLELVVEIVDGEHLQWSRGLLTAETVHHRLRRGIDDPPFNGAAVF